MEENKLPKYDSSNNPTNCCPRFNCEGWEDQELHFRDKLFVKTHTWSILHIPLNMGSMYPRTMKAIENAGAYSDDDFIVMSHDPSSWRGEHYFAVTKEVPGQEMVKISGDFLCKVFEGPYRDAGKWCQQMESYVKGKGKMLEKLFFFYTTCPKCAKEYGKNYVVAVAQVV